MNFRCYQKNIIVNIYLTRLILYTILYCLGLAQLLRMYNKFTALALLLIVYIELMNSTVSFHFYTVSYRI